MSEKTESASNATDMAKWVLAIGLLIAAVVGNYFYQEMSVLYRALAVVVAVIAALLVASRTEKGEQFIAFAKESRIEVRKVVWPTRQEATQTTMIVLVATVVMALLLWGLDGIIVRVVGFITGF